MRRISMLVVLSVLALDACSSVAEGPREPAGQADLTGTEAVIQAQVRGAAVAFIDAYASASQDQGAALRSLVAGKTLRRWVHWMGVQTEQFPGSIEGNASLAGVGPARTADIAAITTDDRFIREVDLVAQVDLQATPLDGGEVIALTWVLTGPMLVGSDPDGRWKVADFHRNGFPMSAIFQVVDDVGLSAGSRVEVALDSFVATPTWQFNLVVSVDGSPPISLEAADVSLVDASGTVVAAADEVTDGLRSIEPGTTAEGVVAFQGRADAADLLLRLDFGAPKGSGVANDVPIVEISLEGVIQPLPIASPSPAP